VPMKAARNRRFRKGTRTGERGGGRWVRDQKKGVIPGTETCYSLDLVAREWGPIVAMARGVIVKGETNGCAAAEEKGKGKERRSPASS